MQRELTQRPQELPLRGGGAFPSGPVQTFVNLCAGELPAHVHVIEVDGARPRRVPHVFADGLQEVRVTACDTVAVKPGAKRGEQRPATESAYGIFRTRVPLSVVDGRLSKVVMTSGWTSRRDDSDDHPVIGETHRLPRRAPVSPSSPATEAHALSSRSWPTWN